MTGKLADIADKARKSGFKAPAITIVGEVVNLRQNLRWFDNRPLFGKNILVTRAADQAGEFSRILALQGATVIECPTISLAAPDSLVELDAALDELATFAWLILTSGNAVRRFFSRLYARGLDTRALAACRVAAVGPKSAAAVREYGVIPDLVPIDYKAEGVVAEFGRLDIAGKRVLFPRADKARDLIPTALAAMGALVSAPVIYCNRLPESLPQEALLALEEQRIDCITFTASSTVENLATILGENRFLRLLEGVRVASIGPITTKSCLELGLNVDIEPEKYTLEMLADQIVKFFDR
jgi:uroporphyrinogen III methyltransferase/synthase